MCDWCEATAGDCETFAGTHELEAKKVAGWNLHELAKAHRDIAALLRGLARGKKIE